MPNRKLQVFISSTYEDLIPERLVAIEAVLAAGHIPTAMEQFTPGDETAWENIRRWIDLSDAFILIVGGRYGSIEPKTFKSYVELEYDYALKQSKPFFALILSPESTEDRIKRGGSRVVELDNPALFKAFIARLREKHCGSWDSKQDIKAAIFQKLPEWAEREDLVGWVRGDQVASRSALEEVSRLSAENRELRGKLSELDDRYEGFSYNELWAELERPYHDKLSPSDLVYLSLPTDTEIHTPGGLFAAIYKSLGAGSEVRTLGAAAKVEPLVSFGLVEKESAGNGWMFKLTPLGRRFRNRWIATYRAPSTDS